jgi:hypothetical protein
MRTRNPGPRPVNRYPGVHYPRRVEGALHTIETLLRDYGRVYEANLAGIAYAGWCSDPHAACRAINCAEWWESADSVAAIDLAVEGGFTPGARRDAQRFRAALTEVLATMLAYGQHNRTGEIVVSQFQKWDESRI